MMNRKFTQQPLWCSVHKHCNSIAKMLLIIYLCVCFSEVFFIHFNRSVMIIWSMHLIASVYVFSFCVNSFNKIHTDLYFGLPKIRNFENLCTLNAIWIIPNSNKWWDSVGILIGKCSNCTDLDMRKRKNS